MVQRNLVVLLGGLLAGPLAAEPAGQWACEALRGTAYEFSAERDHWLTRVFPVEEIYTLRKEPGDPPRWTISHVEGEKFACAPDGKAGQLDCQGGGEIRIDLAMAVFSVGLPPLEGQIARTAVGRCWPQQAH